MRAPMAKAPSAERRAAPSATSGGSPSPRQSQQRRCTGSSPSQHCSVHTCLRHHRQKRLGSLRLHLSHSVGVRGLGGTWPLRACAICSGPQHRLSYSERVPHLQRPPTSPQLYMHAQAPASRGRSVFATLATLVAKAASAAAASAVASVVAAPGVGKGNNLGRTYA